MAITKCINSESKQYKPVLTDKLVLDAVPTVNSLNSVTSDAVARAIAGASGEVPQVTENDNGKVLKAVYDEGGPAVEWGEATVDQTYDATSTNAQSGVAVAQAIAAIPSASYTAGDGIDISAQDEISVKAGNGITIADYTDEHTSTINLTATPVVNWQGSYYAYYIAQLTSDMLAQMNSTNGLQVTLNGAYNEPQTDLYVGLATNATTVSSELSNRVAFGSSLGQSIEAGTTVTFDFAELNGSLSTKSYEDVAEDVSSYYLVVLCSRYGMVGNAGQAAPSADPITTGTYTITETITVQDALCVSNPLPASTSTDAGKVLTVNAQGAAAWGMLGSVKSIQQVNALPATPDANTLYLIPEA